MTDETVIPEASTSNVLQHNDGGVLEGASKKPRTSEDFYLFCKFVLEYEKYDSGSEAGPSSSKAKTKTVRSKKVRERPPRTIKTRRSSKEQAPPSSSPTPPPPTHLDISSDEDSHDLITCFCNKPFGGRPMIECCECFTWVHLRCARVRKNQIPDVWKCSKCKSRQ